MGLFKPNIEKMKVNKDVRGLLKALSNKDEDVRKKAVVALGEIRDPAAVEPLIKALKDRVVFKEAAFALGNIGDIRAIEPLDKILRERGSGLSDKAAEYLAKMGKPGIERLIQALTDEKVPVGDSVRIRASAAFGLGCLQDLLDPQVIKSLIKASKAWHKEIRCEAIRSLSHSREPRAVNAVFRAFQSKDASDRRSAAIALGNIGGKKAVNALTQALKDHNVRDRVVKILYQLGWKPGNDEEKTLCLIAEEKWDELKALGEKVIDPLTQELARPSIHYDKADKYQVEAGKILANLGEPAVKPLAQVSGSIAMGALQKIMGSQSTESLIKMLKNEDEHLQKAAENILSGMEDAVVLKTASNMGYKEAVECLYHPVRIVNSEWAVNILVKLAISNAKVKKKAIECVQSSNIEELGFVALYLSAMLSIRSALEPLLNIALDGLEIGFGFEQYQGGTRQIPRKTGLQHISRIQEALIKLSRQSALSPEVIRLAIKAVTYERVPGNFLEHYGDSVGAVRALCRFKNPAVSNILYKITQIRDRSFPAPMGYDAFNIYDEGRTELWLRWDEHREIASEELTRRNFSSYDPLKYFPS